MHSEPIRNLGSLKLPMEKIKFEFDGNEVVVDQIFGMRVIKATRDEIFIDLVEPIIE